MQRNRLALLALALLATAVSPAWAQRSSSGTFGSRSLGGTLGGSQSSAFGGSGLGSTGMTGSGGSDVGQVSGSERFVRGSRQAGQFVGSDATDARMVGQQNANASDMAGGLGMGGGLNGRGGTGQLGGLFGNQNMMNQLNRNMQNNNQNMGGGRQRQLRTSIRLGFDGPLPASPQATAQFERRLTKIPQLQVTGPVSVTMEGSTAVLRGLVGSERDRDLAARLALLEPGIADVRNELEVRPAPTPPAQRVPVPAAEVTPPVND